MTEKRKSRHLKLVENQKTNLVRLPPTLDQILDREIQTQALRKVEMIAAGISLLAMLWRVYLQRRPYSFSERPLIGVINHDESEHPIQ